MGLKMSIFKIGSSVLFVTEAIHIIF